MKSYGLKTVISERKMKDFFGHLVQERDSQIQQLRDEVRSLQEKCQAARAKERGSFSNQCYITVFASFLVKKIPLSRRVEYVMDGCRQ